MSKFLFLCISIILILLFSGYEVMAQMKENSKADIKSEKVLIVYYSYSGNTRKVAEAIHNKCGGDLFEIKAESTYPEEYRAMTQQVKKEIQDGFRPKLTSEVNNIEKYDVIFLGSPNWWGTIPPQVSSFLENYDLNGKIIVPFITHGGGGVQNTITDIRNRCKNCKVISNGWSGYGSTTAGLADWLENLEFERKL